MDAFIIPGLHPVCTRGLHPRLWSFAPSGLLFIPIQIIWNWKAIINLPPWQIHLHDSGDEEDERKYHKGNSEVFIESRVSLLPGENLIESTKNEIKSQEQSENHRNKTSYAREVCIEVVDEISGSKKNHKNSEFFHRLNIERIV